MGVNGKRPADLQNYLNDYRLPKDYDFYTSQTVKREELIGKRRRKNTAASFFGWTFFLLAVLSAVAFGWLCSLGDRSFESEWMRQELIGAEEAEGGFTYTLALLRSGVDKLYADRLRVSRNITVEASGETLTLTGRDFSPDTRVELPDGGLSFTPDTPGVRRVELMCYGRPMTVFVHIEDTTPPVGTAVEGLKYWNGDPLSPEDLVSDIQDVSEVTSEITVLPEIDSSGEYDYTVTLTDSFGNSSDVVCTVDVKVDSTPPEMYGVEDRVVYIGSAIAYKEGIYVSDDHDDEVEIKVDISDVDPNVPGEYEVTFTALDNAGNSVAETAVFTFRESEEVELDAELDALTTELLDSILTDGMTMRDKAWAIYQWMRKNVAYIPWVDKSDWKRAAVEGLKKHRGSCFTFYAVSRALLTKAEIPNLPVRKKPIPGRSDHYWNLVDCGEGWYHFDTVRRGDGTVFFMWTDARLRKYSDDHHNSHDFDPEITPPTPLE